jgi:hypothetical protein
LHFSFSVQPVTPRVRKPAARKKAVLSPQDEVVEVDVVYPLNGVQLNFHFIS